MCHQLACGDDRGAARASGGPIRVSVAEQRGDPVEDGSGDSGDGASEQGVDEGSGLGVAVSVHGRLRWSSGALCCDHGGVLVHLGALLSVVFGVRSCGGWWRLDVGDRTSVGSGHRRGVRG